jgi:Mannosyltransferase (PIG-V)
MTVEATPAQGRRVAVVRDSGALRAAMRIGLSTRAVVLLVAVFAALSFGPASGGLARENADKFDEPELTHAFADPLLAPLARWDSVWYLRIANSGYGDSGRAAFFPLYPLLVRSVGTLLGGSHGALLVAAYLVSLAAFLAALVLLHRLTELELGTPLARPTLLLLAVFPAALYFGAPYSESLFLLLAVGAFYAARTDRWGWAGACAGLASGTRSAGLLLLLPLALIWWGSRPRRPRDAAWLVLVEGDALRFLDVQDAWSRELAVPLAGAWDGLVAAVDGVRQLASGSRTPVYFEAAAGDPFRIAAINVMLFAALVFAVVACVGVLRRLPRPYGVWVGASLVLPLSFPVTPQPLMSLPRFVSVLFPIFMWLALVCEERRATDLVAVASAVGLGLFTAQYASWHWIS